MDSGGLVKVSERAYNYAYYYYYQMTNPEVSALKVPNSLQEVMGVTKQQKKTARRKGQESCRLVVLHA